MYRIACAVLVIAVITGCGGSVQTDVQPYWADGDTGEISKHYPPSDYVAAVGTAPGEKDDSGARHKAEIQAMNEINRRMKVSLTSVVTTVDTAVAEYTGAKAGTYGSSTFLSDTAAFSKGTLSGVVCKHWYDRSKKRYYVLAVLEKEENYNLMIQKGTRALSTGSLDTALKCFSVAKALRPLEAEPYFRLALVFEKKGFAGQAVALYEDIEAGTAPGRWKTAAAERLDLVRGRSADAMIQKARTSGLAKGAALFRQALVLASGRSAKNNIAAEYQDFILEKTAEKIITAAETAGISKIGVFEIKDEFGSRSSSGSAVAAKLTAELASVPAGRVSVIERSRILEVIDETEVTDPLALQEIGERFGVQGMIVGTVGRRVNIRLLKKSDASILAAVSEDWFGSEKGIQDLFETDGKSPARQKIELEIAMFGQRKIGGEWIDVDVRDGGVMSSGDLFRVYFSVSRDAYVYVLFYSSQGEASVLFPESGIFLASRVKAGKKVVIPPGADKWYWLDNVPGKETFYFIASVEPLGDIEKLIPEMEKAGGARKVANVIRTRGIGGITKGKNIKIKAKHSGSVSRVSEIVTGTGDAVRIITINHR